MAPNQNQVEEPTLIKAELTKCKYKGVTQRCCNKKQMLANETKIEIVARRFYLCLIRKFDL
jgi:hypothetical protein